MAIKEKTTEDVKELISTSPLTAQGGQHTEKEELGKAEMASFKRKSPHA